MKYIYYFNGVREYPWIYASLFINVESTRVIIFFFSLPLLPTDNLHRGMENLFDVRPNAFRWSGNEICCAHGI